MANYPAKADIYALRDPFTMRFCYVGASVDPVKRLKGHISAARQTKGYRQPVADWIKDLLDEGVKPELVILKRGSTSVCDDERMWMARLWRGFLFNFDTDIRWGTERWFCKRFPDLSFDERSDLRNAWYERINLANGWMRQPDGTYLHASELTEEVA